jgi:flavin reductase (DIM6/NTAB) family NADH-FMN oxidoreductase RutF
MAKRSLKPTTAVFPLPTVLVTCQDAKGRSSIITISFIGVVNSDPPMVGIAVRPSRYSHPIIKESMEFVVNIPSEKMLKVSDFCGIASGRNVNKFEATGLTPIPSEKVKVPSITECPLSLECVVKQILSLGSHDLFIAEIVAVRADEEVIGANQSSVDLAKILPFAYCPGGTGALEYWSLKEHIGNHGFTKGKM